MRRLFLILPLPARNLLLLYTLSTSVQDEVDDIRPDGGTEHCRQCNGGGVY